MPGYDDYVVQLEAIRKLAQGETEYWMARELRSVLGYERWENFSEAITRAMDSCASADVRVENHFRETTKMVSIGSGVKRATDDWFLSRYACYHSEASRKQLGSRL